MNSISNSDDNIFDVIDFHQETKPDSVSPPQNKLIKIKTYRKRRSFQLEKQFIQVHMSLHQVACMSKELIEARQLIQQTNRKERIWTMRKFMKIWIVLEKSDLLQESIQVFKSHLKLQRSETNKQYENLIYNILLETDLKQAYKIYCGSKVKQKVFKSGLAELNKFRRQMRKFSSN